MVRHGQVQIDGHLHENCDAGTVVQSKRASGGTRVVAGRGIGAASETWGFEEDNCEKVMEHERTYSIAFHISGFAAIFMKAES